MADINKVYLSSLILAYLLQFQNVTLLTSPLLSLLIGSVLARYFQVKLRTFDDTFLTFAFLPARQQNLNYSVQSIFQRHHYSPLIFPIFFNCSFCSFVTTIFFFYS